MQHQAKELRNFNVVGSYCKSVSKLDKQVLLFVPALSFSPHAETP